MSGTPGFLDRVALVTGGASGIGLAVATRLHALGARVVIADMDVDRAKAACKGLAGAKHRPAHVRADISRLPDVEAMVEFAAGQLGRIDILVHSAGIGVEKPFLTTTEDEWQRLIGVDLTGTFLCGQAVARVMKDQGYGRIVNLASTAGLRGGTDRAAYGAAKGGVIALTSVMAVELAPYGITVNALAPGAIETELVKKMHTPQTRSAYLARIPMGRYGTPEETAAAAVFLCSEEASYITGHVLSVDGGFLAAGVVKQLQ